MYSEQLHPATEPSALLWGGAGEGEASTGVVVATDPASADADGDNGPFFTIQHDSESVMSVRMVRRYGIRASSEERSNAQYPTG
jgi:hypothetical protein